MTDTGRVYLVREVGGGDEWTTVEAFDVEDAAEKYAADVYPYSEGQHEFEVEVEDQKGDVSRWAVEVDYEPQFYARPMKEETK